MKRGATMDEALLTIRNLHRILIGLSAAILLFTISPRRTDYYKNALKELKTIRTIDFGKYVEYAENIIDDEFRDLPWLNQKKIFPKGEILTTLTPSKVLPCDFGKAQIEKLSSDSLIESWLEFFESDYPIKVFIPNSDTDELKSVLHDIQIYNETPLLASLYKFEFQVDEDFVLNDDTKSASIWAEYGPSKGSRSITNIEVPGRVVYIKNKSFREWLEKQKIYMEICIQIGSSQVFLPSLKNIRSEIDPLTRNEAVRHIEEKIISERKQVEIFGLEVDERLLIVAGPISLLLTLIYLLSHFRNLYSKSPPYKEQLQIFPWIGFFNGILSKFITHTSIVILPGTSMILFLLNRNLSLKFEVVFAWLSSIIIFVTSILVSNEIKKINNSLYSQKDEQKSAPKK
jgi:hypothetical protein